MAQLKVRFVINKGRHGAPMSKLGKISEQAEKFLRALAADSKVAVHPGEWLAVNFKNGSVEYDAEFQGDVGAGEAQVFVRSLEMLADYDPEIEGLNVLVPAATALEYAKIGTLIDPDEVVSIGIYPARGGRIKWRTITYSKTASLRREIEAPLPSYGAVQGVLYSWAMGAKTPSFQLRELATDSLIRVFYPIALYGDVARAVQERTTIIMTSGNMLFDRTTRQATEIQADRIERMRMLSSEEFQEFFGSAPEFEPPLEADVDG